MSSCVIPEGRSRCGRPVDAAAPLPLCDRHFVVAHDWVARELGISDVLPAPCAACGSRIGVQYPSGWVCAVCEWRVGDRPDAESVAVRVDVVYYIRFRDRIKIGTSSDPRRRLRALWHDEVLAFELGDRLVEQRRHAQFAAHRIERTEWFDAHPELDDHIARLREGVEDPWARYDRWRSAAIALHG